MIKQIDQIIEEIKFEKIGILEITIICFLIILNFKLFL